MYQYIKLRGWIGLAGPGEKRNLIRNESEAGASSGCDSAPQELCARLRRLEGFPQSLDPMNMQCFLPGYPQDGQVLFPFLRHR